MGSSKKVGARSQTKCYGKKWAFTAGRKTGSCHKTMGAALRALKKKLVASRGKIQRGRITHESYTKYDCTLNKQKQFKSGHGIHCAKR